MVVLLILIGAFFEARACLFDAREGIDLKSLKQGAFLEYMYVGRSGLALIW